MKKTLGLLGMAAMLGIAAQAQVTQPVMPPGKIAVFKAGTSDGIWPMLTARCAPCFVQVFDPAISNQASPLISVAMSTNTSVAGSVWINHHAGSEGGGLSRSVDRRYLALEGYTGDILTPTSAKPSTDPTVSRGIVTLDAFTNAISVYSSLNSWFGIPVGSPSGTQDNPTGIASTDGTNFWGTGNFAGTSEELDGTLFYSPYVTGGPFEVQNFIQAAAEARVIGGTLYVVVPGSGVFNFVNPATGNVVPLPYDPNVANPYQAPSFTNLFLNWGSQFQNIANFDMNPAGTIAYGADQAYGIVKFTNNSGVWVQAPYYFNTTNLGTTAQAPGNQGCFGICVDFSETNPVIYASTMENGYPVPNTAAGHQNQNRLISIVDTGIDPGTNQVATTLAVASTTNEFFGGIDFTPDLTPLITTNPADYATTNGGSATYNIGVNAAFALTYQWLEDSNELAGATNATLTLTNLTTDVDGSSIQCIVADEYGSVTSAPALLTVTLNPTLPVITSGTNNVIGYVSGYTTFPGVSATGTQPFTYQWYFGSMPLVDDGVTYFGSAGSSLTVSNLTTTNSGNYYLVVMNSAGYASNLVDVLTVNYHTAIINAGQPQSVTTFVGTPTSVTANESGATPPVTYQWYLGKTALSDTGDYIGSATPTLSIAATTTADSGTNYYIVVTNPGGSVTSSVASVTVIVPPAHSSISYSNQVYSQTFDSLPDPGTAGVNKNGTAKGNGASVNSFNNTVYLGQLNGVAYSLANPFDFTYPVINNSYIGGLGISKLTGWYGAADTLYPGVGGYTRFGAQDGDQTTGGVIDFGPNDTENGIAGTNRALGLLSTGTTGSTTFGLKLVNTSTNTLNAISVSFIGELWHNGTSARTMAFGYALDNTANSFVLTAQSISNSTVVPALSFSFPTAKTVTTVDGTQATNQVDLATNDLSLSTPWQPGAALWLIWSINYYGTGSGNGYAIDNLSFSATNQVVSPPPSLPITIIPTSTQLTGTGASTALQFSFTNTPGLSFSVLGTNDITAPISTWPVVGTVTDNPPGSGNYQFTDPNPATNGAQFYILRQP